jgi:hypothetical protein
MLTCILRIHVKKKFKNKNCGKNQYLRFRKIKCTIFITKFLYLKSIIMYLLIYNILLLV